MFEDLNPDCPAPVPPLMWGASPPAESAPPAGASDMSDPSDTPETNAGDLPDDSAAELSDWKDSLRHDFEDWLAGLDEIPATDIAEGSPTEAPDLYDFHQQLAAANAEARKANRRSAEAISQWGDTLARFEGTLAPLRETVAVLAAAQPKEGRMARPHCLIMVELLDRMHRIARAFQAPPKGHWWQGDDTLWRKAWETQRQGFNILVSHLEELLKKEGVTRIDTLGQPFDPAVMTAIAAESDATRPPQTVLEELAAGYHRHGELLRPAQVKVSRQP